MNDTVEFNVRGSDYADLVFKAQERLTEFTQTLKVSPGDAEIVIEYSIEARQTGGKGEAPWEARIYAVITAPRTTMRR